MSYNDLVNVPSFGKKRENFDPERGDVVFYCRDCSKVVEAIQIHPVKLRYECSLCKGHNLSIGTNSSVRDFYAKRR
jgi:Zn finger protein HypA/HybF involved in hydrogenase expression